ncbi:MAG TPA: hypothetical protein VIL64_02165, partial [Solirubrobacteraceae bacterium]
MAALLVSLWPVALAMADKGGTPNGGNGGDNSSQHAQGPPGETPSGQAPGPPAGDTPGPPAQPAPPVHPQHEHGQSPGNGNGGNAGQGNGGNAGKGNAGHGNPGQGNGGQHGHGPPTALPPAAHHGHPAKPKRPVTPNSPHAQAGKITICHATGSSTNPYVEITISRNGLNGHGKHADDIIPAPAGGCPTSATTPVTGSTTPVTGSTTPVTGSTTPVTGSGTDRGPPPASGDASVVASSLFGARATLANGVFGGESPAGAVLGE